MIAELRKYIALCILRFKELIFEAAVKSAIAVKFIVLKDILLYGS